MEIALRFSAGAQLAIAAGSLSPPRRGLGRGDLSLKKIIRPPRPAPLLLWWRRGRKYDTAGFTRAPAAATYQSAQFVHHFFHVDGPHAGDSFKTTNRSPSGRQTSSSVSAHRTTHSGQSHRRRQVRDARIVTHKSRARLDSLCQFDKRQALGDGASRRQQESSHRRKRSPSASPPTSNRSQSTSP